MLILQLYHHLKKVIDQLATDYHTPNVFIIIFKQFINFTIIFIYLLMFKNNLI